MPTQPEFDDYDDYEQGGFSWMLVLVLVLAISGFFALAWYAYQTGTEPKTPDQVLIVKADPEPVVTEPDDPGGREFPHQEKTIYNALQAQKPESSVTVAPEPETPQLVIIGEEAPEDKEPPTSADKKIAELFREAVEDTQSEREERVEKPKPVEQPAAKPTPLMPREEPRAEKPAASEPKVASGRENPSLSGAVVQLGAFRGRIEAEKHWQKISRTNDDVLGGRDYAIIRADLGDRGVFYRLRAGFESKQAAESACATLKSRQQGCYLVRN